MFKPLPIYFFCLLITGQVSAQSYNTDNTYSEGVKLKNEQRYSEALNAFKNAIDKNPDNPDALFEAGWLCNELKDYDNAINYLQEAKQLKPSPNIYFELGYAYENLGRKNEAKENYKISLELFPKYYDADKHLGDIFYSEENYTMALNYYRKYFETTKTPDTYYYYKAGKCANDLKDYVDALLYLEKYEPNTRKDFAIKYAETGYAYFMTGYNDDAVSAYQKALDANPTYGVALRGLADVYYNNLEDYNKALEYFNLALQNDEENSKDCYYKAGWIYVNQQKYNEATAVLEKAADYDAKDVNTREQLGYAYFMQNKYDEAINQFNKAIEMDNESRVSYFYNGLCYASLNQKTNAMAAYGQLKQINKDDAEKLLKEIKQKEKMQKSLASNASRKEDS